MRHRLSASAVRDLARLYRRSVLGFGLVHANRYLDQLNETFGKIGEAPEASPPRPEYRGNVRIRRVEAHHIIYRIDPSEVVILRVLHGRQDIGRYL